MRISSPELTKDISLIVTFDPPALSDYISLNTRRTVFSPSRSYKLNDSGVILTEQIARQFAVEVGDTVSLRNFEGDSADFTVIGIIENYTLHYAYISPATYKSAYGEMPQANRVFVLSKSGHGELPQSLLDDPEVTAVMHTTVLSAEVDSELDVLTFVVVILIISAGILIFVVLFSLTTINIEERRRELASIEVLGFFDHELAAYIYRENIVLTVIGALVGIGLGILLQRYIITTLEIDMFMFSRDLLWTSYAIALVLTFIFATAVNLIMYRPLTRIDMVEALKAVE
jgi:putative ABC transport system permease protein